MIDLEVNGQRYPISADPETPLLYVLRNDLQLNGAKFGCGLGQCGACTVLVDGAPALSCVTPLLLVAGRRITTLEGLGTIENPGPLQQAFMEEQAAQCGYCIAGMMLRAQALLQRNLHASEAEIRAQLEPNLCRCGTHMRILRAVRRAGVLMQEAGTAPSKVSSGDGNTIKPTPTGRAAEAGAGPPDAGSQTDEWRRGHSAERERPER